ncbi:hypothetical protein CHARACLAT_006207 [Characodon lateralis]|uniref:Uncharacterized protein n=1 Tax=Characodon lateralis TaxID=208331 RepID=A0ABU7D6X5_9TELE|nr:hypothetical protein [Characodon lateralis]
MAVVVQSHSLAGPVCLLPKLLKSTKRSWHTLSTYLLFAFIFLYLLVCATCHRTMDENQVLCLTKRSQHFLFTKILDDGHARPPQDKNGQSSKPLLGIVQFLLILILAGDVEINPGPAAWVSTSTMPPPWLSGPQPLLPWVPPQLTELLPNT